jgi:hypothetical protein
MANNGYLVNGVCTSDFSQYVLVNHCPSGTAYVYITLQSNSFFSSESCWSSSGVRLRDVSAYFANNFSCQIAGPSLTDVEQIQAVNQILPYALAFLASIWAMKKIFQVLWNSSISFSGKKEQE